MRYLRTAAVFAAIMGVLLAVAGPAGATTAQDDGYLNIFSGPNYQGTSESVYIVKPGHCFWLDFPVRSTQSQSPWAIRLWSNSNCTGVSYVVWPGNAVPELYGTYVAEGGYP